jgi:hypothetical protein
LRVVFALAKDERILWFGGPITEVSVIIIIDTEDVCEAIVVVVRSRKHERVTGRGRVKVKGF